MPSEVRERVLEATLRCVARGGLAELSLEEVATEAEVGRATIYRHFPGGRAQLLEETTTFEVARFFSELKSSVGEGAGLATFLEEGLRHARRSLAQNELLQKLLRSEPDELLNALVATEPFLLDVLRRHIRASLDQPGDEGSLDPELAADYLARLFLSYVVNEGPWDLGDPAVVKALVETQFLAGLGPAAADSRLSPRISDSVDKAAESGDE